MWRPPPPVNVSLEHVVSKIKEVVEADPRGASPEGLNGPTLGQILAEAGIRPHLAGFRTLGDAVRHMNEIGLIQLRVAPGGQIFVWSVGAVVPPAVPMQVPPPQEKPLVAADAHPTGVAPASEAAVASWTPRPNPFRTEVWKGMVYDRFTGDRLMVHRSSGEVRNWRDDPSEPTAEWVELVHIGQDLQREWAKEYLSEFALEDRVNWNEVGASGRWFEGFGVALDGLGGMHRREWNTFRHRRVQKLVSEWAAQVGISESILYAGDPRRAGVTITPSVVVQAVAAHRMRELTARAYELVILNPELDTRTRAQLVIAALRPGGWLTGG